MSILQVMFNKYLGKVKSELSVIGNVYFSKYLKYCYIHIFENNKFKNQSSYVTLCLLFINLSYIVTYLKPNRIISNNEVNNYLQISLELQRNYVDTVEFKF